MLFGLQSAFPHTSSACTTLVKCASRNAVPWPFTAIVPQPTLRRDRAGGLLREGGIPKFPPPASSGGVELICACVVDIGS